MRAPGYYSGKMAELRAARGDKCEWCGLSHDAAKLRHPNGLEFAHVVTTTLNGASRGRAERYHDIKNNPEAYELLCRGCHFKQEERGGPRLPMEVPF